MVNRIFLYYCSMDFHGIISCSGLDTRATSATTANVKPNLVRLIMVFIYNLEYFKILEYVFAILKVLVIG